MDYEEFSAEFGSFGWYTCVLLTLISLSGAVTHGLTTYTINFLGTRRDHRCFTNHTEEQKLEYGIPWDADTNEYSSCSMYALAPSHNESHRYDDLIITKCQFGWEYDTSSRDTTYISEWNLVCDDAWIVEFVIPLFIATQFSTSFVLGPISNRFGRKYCLLGVMLLNMIGCTANAFSVNIFMFIATRTITAAGNINCLSLAYVLSSEITPNRQRSLTQIVVYIAFCVGVLLSTGLSYFIRDWRMLSLACAFTILPLLFIVVLFVPESPQWLAWKGRHKEAAVVLATIARRNGAATLTKEKVHQFLQTLPKRDLSNSKKIEADSGSLKELFSHSVTRRCAFTCFLGWGAASLQYIAVSYNVDSLFGDIFINNALMTLVGVASVLLLSLAMSHVGRVTLLTGSFVSTVLVGITSVLLIELKGPDMAVTVCAIVIRALGDVCNVLHYVLIVELFPTSIRNQIMGLATAAGYAFGITGPYLAGPSLTQYWAPAPYVVFSVMSMLASWFSSWLPETKDISLPETIEDLESLKRSPDTDINNKNLSSNVEKGPISYINTTFVSGENLIKNDLSQLDNMHLPIERTLSGLVCTNTDIVEVNSKLTAIVFHPLSDYKVNAESNMSLDLNRSASLTEQSEIELDAAAYETLLSVVAPDNLNVHTFITRL